MTKKVTHRDWLNYAINVQKSPISNLQTAPLFNKVLLNPQLEKLPEPDPTPPDGGFSP